MARPGILNDELIEKMAEEIRGGLTIDAVCDLFYVHSTSYYGWMNKGEEDIKAGNHDTQHAKFFYEIKKARAEFEKASKDFIANGKIGWQGRAWWLERTNPKFMPKQQIQADDDGKVTVVIGGKEKKK